MNNVTLIGRLGRDPDMTDGKGITPIEELEEAVKMFEEE